MLHHVATERPQYPHGSAVDGFVEDFVVRTSIPLARVWRRESQILLARDKDALLDAGAERKMRSGL